MALVDVTAWDPEKNRIEILLINWLNLAFFENIWLIIATMSCYLGPNSSHPGELAITTSDKKYLIQGKTEKEGFVTIRFELFHSIRKNI